MESNIAHDIDSIPRTDDVILVENIHFRDMFFSEQILSSLEENGFRKPSPIQNKTIPLTRSGFDLIVESKSGTGKTLVFVLTALEMIDVLINRVQCIVLAPTREIALQVTEVFKAVGKNIEGLSVATFIGGMPIASDIEALKKCHIAVGAPGRIKHLVETKYMQVEAVRLFVLDEADQLMNESFQNEINFIFKSLSAYKQMLAVSATYTSDLIAFLSKYLRSPIHVTPDSSPLKVLRGITQFVTISKPHSDSLARINKKEQLLAFLLSSIKFNQCIVFTNYQLRVESVANNLKSKGWPCVWLSGCQSQPQRIKALNELRNCTARTLVTTDLAARGIDSKHIDLVINMDEPRDSTSYLHRMGRAGRYGSQGIVVTLLSEGDSVNNFRKMLRNIGGECPSVYIIPKNNEFDLSSEDKSMFDRLKIIIDEHRTGENSDSTKMKVKLDMKEKENRLSKGGSNDTTSQDCPVGNDKGKSTTPKKSPKKCSYSDILRLGKNSKDNSLVNDLLSPRKRSYSEVVEAKEKLENIRENNFSPVPFKDISNFNRDSRISLFSSCNSGKSESDLFGLQCSVDKLQISFSDILKSKENFMNKSTVDHKEDESGKKIDDVGLQPFIKFTDFDDTTEGKIFEFASPTKELINEEFDEEIIQLRKKRRSESELDLEYLKVNESRKYSFERLNKVRKCIDKENQEKSVSLIRAKSSSPSNQKVILKTISVNKNSLAVLNEKEGSSIEEQQIYEEKSIYENERSQSTTSDASSNNDGEYIASQSYINSNLHRSDNAHRPFFAPELPNTYSDWMNIYRRQLSVISNYVLYTKYFKVPDQSVI